MEWERTATIVKQKAKVHILEKEVEDFSGTIVKTKAKAHIIEKQESQIEEDVMRFDSRISDGTANLYIKKQEHVIEASNIPIEDETAIQEEESIGKKT